LVLLRHELSSSVFQTAMAAGIPAVVAANDVDGMASAVERHRITWEAIRGPADANGERAGRVITVFGEAAAAGGTPGMTGTLTLRYQLNTPLGACSAEAWVDRREGVKTIVKGELRRADGTVTVTAEGVFILPRWAREKLAEEGGTPPQYE
jgi:hypothetical protein